MRDSSSLVFGRYAVLRRLAVGGMGEIFLARQVGVSGFERPVILKSLLPDMLDHEGSVEMFLDEARVAGRLNHPNVVSLYEVGEWQGTFYIAMEYIEGEDLGRLARHARRVGTPLAPRVCAEVIRDAALGLDHAHHATDAQGVLLELVHRDISPQNIMVRLDGVTKVVDFGVAKAANRSTRTRTGVLKGKLRYMSPEQIRNESLDGRSDQFALGVVLWELCTNRPLFETENPAQAMQHIVVRPAPRPSSLVEGISPMLDAIILRMLSKAREQRFARCADVARALQAYLDDSPAAPGGDVATVVTRLVGETVRARMRDATEGAEGLLLRGGGSNVSCPNCGQATSGTARFCPHCGNALNPQGAAARLEVPTTPLSGRRAPALSGWSEPVRPEVPTTPGGGAQTGRLPPEAGAWGARPPPPPAEAWEALSPPPPSEDAEVVTRQLPGGGRPAMPPPGTARDMAPPQVPGARMGMPAPGAGREAAPGSQTGMPGTERESASPLAAGVRATMSVPGAEREPASPHAAGVRATMSVPGAEREPMSPPAAWARAGTLPPVAREPAPPLVPGARAAPPSPGMQREPAGARAVSPSPGMEPSPPGVGARAASPSPGMERDPASPPGPGARAVSPPSVSERDPAGASAAGARAGMASPGTARDVPGARAAAPPSGTARDATPPPPWAKVSPEARDSTPPSAAGARAAAAPPSVAKAGPPAPPGAEEDSPPVLLGASPVEPTTLVAQLARTQTTDVLTGDGPTLPAMDGVVAGHPSLAPTVRVRPGGVEVGTFKRKLTLLTVLVDGTEALRRSLGEEEGLEAAGRLLDTAAAAAERYEAEVVHLSDERWTFAFGLPAASREDPLRAVRCALELQRDVAGLGLLPPPSLRMGLEFDSTLVSGGRGRSPWRVTGVGLDRANALAAAAGPAEVLAGAAIKALLEEEVRFSLAQMLEDGQAWRVEGLGGAARTIPFVGRTDALAAAQAVVESARAMGGGVRLFTGASGMGKSRLLEAVAERASRAAPLRVVHARAGDPRAAGAMGLVRLVLSGLARELGAAPEGSPLQPLTALGFTEPECAALWRRLAQGAPTGQAQAADATVAEALQRAARPFGLLLLVDDLHRADAASLELLVTAVSGPGACVGLVGTAAPDALPPVLASLPVTALEGMPRGELRALLTAGLGAAPGPEVEKLIAERAHGNPSFALELTRALVERGVLQRLGGTWQAAAPLAEVSLPDSLALALGARLDRLQPAAQAFLTRAAVEGGTFSAALVQASLKAEGRGADVLDTLAADGWVVPVPERPGMFRFALDLGRQVLLERLTPSALRKAHQELGEALARPAFAAEPVREVRLADHLLAAAVPGAAAACERAGEWLAARGEWRAAAEYLRRAVGETPGATPPVRLWQLGVLARAAGCLTQVDPAAVAALVAPWLERVPPDESPAAWAEAARRQAAAELKLGRVADAEIRLELAQGPAAADPEVEAWVLGDRARTREARGDVAGAVELLIQAFQRMGGRPARAPDFYWEHLNLLGRLQHRLGQTDRARVSFTRAAEQARAVGSAAGQARALSNLAGLRVLAGEPAAALADLERALALAEQAGDVQEVARIHYNAGRLLVSAGRAPEARERLEKAREHARVAGWREGEALTAQALGALEQRSPRR